MVVVVVVVVVGAIVVGAVVVGADVEAPQAQVNQWIDTWNLKHPCFEWLFQLDDLESLHEQCLFHQTSILNWLFGVPGIYSLIMCGKI